MAGWTFLKNAYHVELTVGDWFGGVAMGTVLSNALHDLRREPDTWQIVNLGLFVVVTAVCALRFRSKVRQFEQQTTLRALTE